MDAQASYGTKTVESTVSVNDHGRKIILDQKSSEDTFPVDLTELGNLPAARVRIAAGVTKNMGEFEFLRADVAIEMPCLPNQKSVESAYEWCANWASGRIEEIIEEAKS